MPKRGSAVVVASALLLTGCTAAGPAESDEPVVLTTFTVLADIAGAVGGEHVRVESITRPGAEVHGYEPTPGDIRRAADASLVIDNGLGLEGWFEQFLADVDAPRVEASEGIETIDIEGTDRPNPHAWMSPANVEVYVENIEAALAELAPEHADDFAANAEAYRAELQQVQADLESGLAGLPENERALVTCEGAFSYLARDAGMTEHYLWPVNAEQQATPQQIAGVIDTVDDDGIRAVFCESTVSDAPMQQVVEATGASFGGTLYVDSLSEADGPVPSYLDLIRHDVDTLVAGLGG